MRYEFAATVAKVLAKPEGQGYASLTVPERWEFHADVYGFRRALLQIPAHIRVSPCDPKGEWFDERRADMAEDFYRWKYRRQVSQSVRRSLPVTAIASAFTSCQTEDFIASRTMA